MIQERLIQYIDYKGISKYKFYKLTGLSNGFLDKRGTIGVDKCEIICNCFAEISIEWLITGKGSMLILEPSSDKTATTNSEPANPTELKLIAALEKNIDYLQKELNECLAQKKGAKTSQTVDANNLE